MPLEPDHRGDSSDRQIFMWHDWFIYRLDKLLAVFNVRALVMVRLQQPPSGGNGVHAVAIHTTPDNQRRLVPVLLRPGEQPIPRPG